MKDGDCGMGPLSHTGIVLISCGNFLPVSFLFLYLPTIACHSQGSPVAHFYSDCNLSDLITSMARTITVTSRQGNLLFGIDLSSKIMAGCLLPWDDLKAVT